MAPIPPPSAPSPVRTAPTSPRLTSIVPLPKTPSPIVGTAQATGTSVGPRLTSIVALPKAPSPIVRASAAPAASTSTGPRLSSIVPLPKAPSPVPAATPPAPRLDLTQVPQLLQQSGSGAQPSSGGAAPSSSGGATNGGGGFLSALLQLILQAQSAIPALQSQSPTLTVPGTEGTPSVTYPGTEGTPSQIQVPGVQSPAQPSPPGPLAWLGALDNVVSIASNSVSLVNAFQSHNGLQVSGVTFQSIEQEGRWKPPGLFAQNKDQNGNPIPNPREFVLAQQDKFSQSGTPPSLAEYYGNVSTYHHPVFVILCANSPLGTRSRLEVDATWWSDEFEIWAGFAGMASAIGFGSEINDTASVTLQAMPLGNYYPAKILITWTGWVSPLGKDYVEFRGGVVVSAKKGECGNASVSSMLDDTSNPCYMQYWKRDGQDPVKDLPWVAGAGFTLDLTN